MVTVNDPGGTPTPIYNRSGSTIQEVIGAGGGGLNSTDQAAASQLVRYSGWDIYVVTSGSGVRLPTNAEIGDLVEVHTRNTTVGYSVNIYTNSGETISDLVLSGQTFGMGQAAGTGSTNYKCSLLRKMAASNWEPLTDFHNFGA